MCSLRYYKRCGNKACPVSRTLSDVLALFLRKRIWQLSHIQIQLSLIISSHRSLNCKASLTQQFSSVLSWIFLFCLNFTIIGRYFIFPVDLYYITISLTICLLLSKKVYQYSISTLSDSLSHYDTHLNNKHIVLTRITMSSQCVHNYTTCICCTT